MNKQQLAQRVWEMANNLRGKVSASAYKDYMLGFIFYKYLSFKEEKYLKEKLRMEDEDIEKLTEKDNNVVKNLKNNIGYFIEYKNFFSTWVLKCKSSDNESTKNAKKKKFETLDISDVSKALSAFRVNIGENFKSVYCTINSDKNEDIFSTLSQGLNDLGSNDANRSKAIRDLVNLVETIPMEGREEYDMLGFVYEFLLKNFAANAGKAGEFYTPHEASLVMSEIIADHLKDKKEISIYDPTSGSGSLLINIGKSIQKHMAKEGSVKYYAQELIHDTYNLTKMNLVMRNISPSNIVVRYGDTLKDDWPYFDDRDKDHTYEPLFVDGCCSNPPYSQSWDITNKDTDPRFNGYGVAPKSKADMAFLLHNLYHLKDDGIMTIVLPHGVLFRGGDEEKIRTQLIERGHIHAIIGLPSNMFFGTGIPTIIMVLRKVRTETDVLFVDASKGFIKDGNKNKLRAKDVKKIVETVINRKTVEKYSRLVSKKEIVENKYNLNIPRYVDSNEPDDLYDIYATMNGGIPNDEIDNLSLYFDTFKSLKDELFKTLNSNYSEYASEDIKGIIDSNKDVANYKKSFMKKLETLPEFLNNNLVLNRKKVNISKTESEIFEKIIEDIKSVKLIDRYDIYETLDGVYNNVALDLEILQDESDDAMRKIDEVVEYKKKKKTTEIEEKIVGYEGRIFSFRFIQNEYFKDDLDLYDELTNEKHTLESEKEELLSSIDPNDKEELLKEKEEDDEGNDDEIDTKKLNAKIKSIKKQKDDGSEYEEGSYEDIILHIGDINEKYSKVKAKIKDLNQKLLKETEEKINSLTKAECEKLLYIKWCEPIISGLEDLVNDIINNVINKCNHMNEKYKTSINDLEKDLTINKKELVKYMDELTGDEYDMKGIDDIKKLLGDAI